MYTIIKSLSENTLLAEKDNSIFVLKRIDDSDVPLFRRLCGISQPELARVFEITVLNDGIYAVSEFVQGIPLKDFIARNGVMNENTATGFVLDLCAALSGLHSLGIVHRDLTPNNIIVTGNFTPVIIDYGISRIGKGNKSSDTDTLGTVGYAAPEQFGFRETDARTDIYALGAVIRFCMTGNPCGKITSSGRIADVAEKCSSYEPSDRYPSAKQVAIALTQQPQQPVFQPPPNYRRRMTASKVLVALYSVTTGLLLLAMNIADAYRPLINLTFSLVVFPACCFNPLYWQDRISFLSKIPHFKKRVIFSVTGSILTFGVITLLKFLAQ